jgi:esterase
MVLAHVRAGAGGRPLVLLHGLLGSARNLSTLGRLLVDRNPELDVVAFDLTGHGASAPLPPGADATTLAADVLNSARALGLRPPLSFVGHSLGGRVALRVALSEPASVGTVSLLDIPPGPLAAAGEVSGVLQILEHMPDSFASRGHARARLIAAGLAPTLADWLLLNLGPGSGGFGWRVDRRALADLHARVAAEDLWPVVEGQRPWALSCVRGGASAFVTDGDVQRLQAAGCPVATIQGAGHFLHVERPDAVAEAVAEGLT